MESNPLYRYWQQHSLLNLHVAAGVLVCCMHAVSWASGMGRLGSAADLLALLAILHFVVHAWVHRQWQFNSDHMRLYALPKREIARTGGRHLGLFMLCSLVLMALVREVYTGTLAAKLWLLLRWLVYTLFGAFLEGGGLGRSEIITQVNRDLLGDLSGLSANSHSMWENILNYVQTVLVVVGLVMMLVLMLWFAWASLRERLGEALGRTGAGAGNISDDVKTAAARRARVPRFGGSESARVRRLYWRHVRRARRGALIPRSATPAEIEELVGLAGAAGCAEMHDLYEKARYSANGCSGAELARMKELA